MNHLCVRIAGILIAVLCSQMTGTGQSSVKTEKSRPVPSDLMSAGQGPGLGDSGYLRAEEYDHFAGPLYLYSTSEDRIDRTASGHVLSFRKGSVLFASGSHALETIFVGARQVDPCEELGSPGSVSRTDAPPTLDRIIYPDLWEGVTVHYEKADTGIVKSTFVIHAGAVGKTDPVDRIRFRYNVSVKIDAGGDLVFSFPTGELRESHPEAWQEISGVKIAVDARFRLASDNEVGFEVGRYDSRYPLVIDPLLRWNTFLGGSANDEGRAIAVDSSGSIFIAGVSYASWGAAPIRAYSGNGDIFIAKLDPNGTLLWNTFLGGAAEDEGIGLLLGDTGNIYVSGYSSATWHSPLSPYVGGQDAFVAMLNVSGVLVWNTFLGATADDSCNDMALSADGGLFLVGGSEGSWGSPIHGHSGSTDAFLAELDGTGSLIWNTFLGGSAGDTGVSIKVGSGGEVLVIGTSAATWGATPIRAYTGGTDAYVASFGSDGTFLWNTFLGGSADDFGYGVGVDSAGGIYAAGWSYSYGTIAWGAPIRPFTRNRDSFIAKLNSSGILQWNTFLGGEYFDEIHDLSVDDEGNIYAVGFSAGTWGSPIVAHAGGYDAFVAGVDTNGALLWSTFLGRSGTLGEYGYGITHDYRGNAFVTGYGGGTWGNPVRPFVGSYDAFVAKIGPDFSTVVIRSPSDGAVVGGLVPIVIDAYDQKGIQKVEVLIDGILRVADTTYPYGYIWDTTGLGGSHSVRAVAYDPENLTVETQIIVNIMNEAPPMIMGHPSSRTVASGSTVLLTVDAVGTLPLAYQWYSGASGDLSDPIPDATSSAYWTPALTSQASYWVRISNTYGTVDSNTAIISIGQPSTLSGTIYDSVTMAGVIGASVTLGALPSDITDDQGRYEISGIGAGDYPLVIMKEGYLTSTSTIGVSVASSINRDIPLSPAGGTEVKIDSLTCKYGGFVYYLEGIDFAVTYTAHVDWGGHEPGSVRFITPLGQYDVAASGDSVSRDFNMGQEFGPCSTLRAVAMSSDGAQSRIESAPFTVMPMPLADVIFEKHENGDSFYYSLNRSELELISELLGSDLIPSDIPFFGDTKFALDTLLQVNATANSSGKIDIDLDMSETPLAQDEWSVGEMAGFRFRLTPELDLKAGYTYPECRYSWEGSSLKLKGDLRIEKSWPFPIFVLGFPVPMYAKASFNLGVDSTLTIENVHPVEMSGELDIAPTLRGTLGAGVDRFISAELWIQGTAAFRLSYPEIPHLSGAIINITAGTTGRAFGFRLWDRELLSWDWNLSGAAIASSPTIQTKTSVDKPEARDYLREPGSGTFFHQAVPAPSTKPALSGLAKISAGLLQDAVYPYSDPALSNGGGALGLIWVQDAPERLDVNRTVASVSIYDGSTWSAPIRIGDDGTADFHPQLLMFADGNAIAIWEDQKIVHADTATLEDLVPNFEISASVYQSGSGTWQPPVRLTDNDYLEGSPLISGVSLANVMATWIANEDNDLKGSPTLPNKIRYSIFNGTSWSAMQLAVQIPFALLKYSLVYNGTTGYVVYCIDADNDPATVADTELYRMTYTSGAWGSPVRMTMDSLPDVNPKMAFDPAGHVILVWMRGNDLVCSVDFGSPAVIFTDEFSTNLADFKLAASNEGRLAIAWAKPDEYSSDLDVIFYDPVNMTWGSAPQQITFDPEIERNIALSFYGADTLVAAYNRTPIETTTATRTTAAGDTIILAIPQPGITDLYVLEYVMGKDLALSPLSFRADPPNPEPGAGVRLTVTAANVGDETAPGIPVAFYLGDPAAGGTLIGETLSPAGLRPGDKVDLSLHWEVPETDAPLRIYAVIDPESSYDTEFRTNNSIDIEIIKADLTINGVNWEWRGSDKVLLTARILNAGVITSQATTLRFRQDSGSGTLISDPVLPPMAKGEFRDLTIEWDVSSLALPEYPVHIAVDEENLVPEYDEVNNWRMATVTPVTVPNTIIVLSPNGGEEWPVGSAQNIRWATSGIVGNVAIDISTDGGMNWVPVVPSAANSGTYIWTVSAAPSSQCLLRVYEEADGVPFDASDGSFSILPALSMKKVDFNGDGQEDILWRYYGEGAYQGLNVAWLMNQAMPASAQIKSASDSIQGRSLLSGEPAGVVYRAEHGLGAPSDVAPGPATKTVVSGEKPLTLEAKRVMRDLPPNIVPALE